MELTAETIGKFTVFKLAGRIDWASAGGSIMKLAGTSRQEVSALHSIWMR